MERRAQLAALRGGAAHGGGAAPPAEQRRGTRKRNPLETAASSRLREAVVEVSAAERGKYVCRSSGAGGGYRCYGERRLTCGPVVRTNRSLQVVGKLHGKLTHSAVVCSQRKRDMG